MSRLLQLALAASVVLWTPAVLSAQSVFTLRAGLNVATLDGDAVLINPDSRIGLYLGGTGTFTLSDNVGVLLGIGFSQKGAEPPVDLGVNPTLAINYLELPALLELSLPTEGPLGAHALLGPAIGIQLSCKATGSAGGIDVELDCDRFGLDTRTFEIGAVGGVGVSYAASERTILSLDVLYNLGLTSVRDGVDVKNRALSIQAGFGVPLG